MKRLFVLLGIALLFASAAAFADEAVLIDFTKLAADYSATGDQSMTDNQATLVSFSHLAGPGYTEAERQQMKTSLALANWEVTLASSSRTVQNQSLTMAKEAVTSPNAKPYDGEEMASRPILGVRVHFPTNPNNSWARIEPPFEIPAYEDKTTVQGSELVVPQDEQGLGRKFDNTGVVKNVGVLRSISITIWGSNYPYGVSLILMDQNHREQQIFIDYLQFEGWRTLTWVNPNYVAEVRDREVYRDPLYPRTAPYIKLTGIVINRDGSQEGGDFVTYIKDVKITYDKAILDQERDINDEQIWGILQARQEARRSLELKRLGNVQVLRYLERQKMHKIETVNQ